MFFNKTQILSITIFILCSDFLFFDQPLGASLALVAMLVFFLILINRPSLEWNKYSILSAVLLLISGIQSVIEFTGTNLLLIIVLSFGFASATSCGKPTPPSCQIPPPQKKEETFAVDRFLLIAIPVTSIAALFLFLLSGNIIFKRFLCLLAEKSSTLLSDAILFIPDTITFARLTFWLIAFCTSLALIYPFYLQRKRPKTDTPQQPPPLPKSLQYPPLLSLNEKTKIQFFIILATVLLFAVSNSIDLLFLLLGSPLPDGITYSEFVHQGLNSLIAASLCSLLILCFFYPSLLQGSIPTRRCLSPSEPNIDTLPSDTLPIFRKWLLIGSYILISQNLFLFCA